MNHLCVSTCEAIKALALKGWSGRRIARELAVNRETVARYLGPSKPAIPPPGSAPLTTPIGRSKFSRICLSAFWRRQVRFRLLSTPPHSDPVAFSTTGPRGHTSTALGLSAVHRFYFMCAKSVRPAGRTNEKRPGFRPASVSLTSY
jgi:hypothetical protein